MKLIRCAQCGGGDFYRDKGAVVCKYCRTRYAIEPGDLGIEQSGISLNSDIEALPKKCRDDPRGDLGIKRSGISLNSDIEVLLKKCRDDPRNARKYANLILDIDPSNREALRFL